MESRREPHQGAAEGHRTVSGTQSIAGASAYEDLGKLGIGHLEERHLLAIKFVRSLKIYKLLERESPGLAGLVIIEISKLCDGPKLPEFDELREKVVAHVLKSVPIYDGAPESLKSVIVSQIFELAETDKIFRFQDLAVEVSSIIIESLLDLQDRDLPRNLIIGEVLHYVKNGKITSFLELTMKLETVIGISKGCALVHRDHLRVLDKEEKDGPPTKRR